MLLYSQQFFYKIFRMLQNMVVAYETELFLVNLHFQGTKKLVELPSKLPT